MLHFHKNTCLKLFNTSSLSSGEIIISFTGSFSTVLPLFDKLIASAILLSINPPTLWTTFLEEVFEKSSPTYNNCFSYILAKDKIHIY